MNTTKNKKHNQYTGMKDVNGIKIYEGDIISLGLIYPKDISCYTDFEEIDGYKEIHELHYVVKIGEYQVDDRSDEHEPLNRNGIYVEIKDVHKPFTTEYNYVSALCDFQYFELKVIGNIYDNSELLDKIVVEKY